jgi:hypothetical protein
MDIDCILFNFYRRITRDELQPSAQNCTHTLCMFPSLHTQTVRPSLSSYFNFPELFKPPAFLYQKDEQAMPWNLKSRKFSASIISLVFVTAP